MREKTDPSIHPGSTCSHEKLWEEVGAWPDEDTLTESDLEPSDKYDDLWPEPDEPERTLRRRRYDEEPDDDLEEGWDRRRRRRKPRRDHRVRRTASGGGWHDLRSGGNYAWDEFEDAFRDLRSGMRKARAHLERGPGS
jgi:hypothetical protein